MLKPLLIVAVPCLVLGLAGRAGAETYTSVPDPSGSAMCFDASGNKAALSACESTAATEKYLELKDPTGVSMCFASHGQKAPLAKCEVKLAAIAPTITRPGSFAAMLSVFR